MARPSKFTKPVTRRVITCEVLAVREISPSFRRVTLGGPELEHFVPMGHDQWFRAFFPNEHGTLNPPKHANGLWMADYFLQSGKTRPVGRNYTVRDFRATSGGPELDVDFAIHSDEAGECGPATRWAVGATPGDRIAILDEGITWSPVQDADWHLLVGDETALPAIAGVLESAARDMVGLACIELPHAEDVQEIDVPAGVEMCWLIRDGQASHGVAAIEAVTGKKFPAGTGHAFLAGGQHLVTTLRRHLIAERGFTKNAITFTGYWR